MSAHDHFHSAGDDEASFEVEGHPASLVRREPVLAAFVAALAALASGVSRGLSRGDRESTMLFGAALALLTAFAWLARRVVTPLAVPRRDAETPLFDAPPDLLA